MAPPAPGVPRRLVVIVLAVFVLAGVGGGLADNYLNAHTVNPGTTPATTPAAAPAAPPPASPRRLGSTLPALMDLVALHEPAPPFQLTDQTGQPVTLASLRGKVVVLSFFNPSCNDICPVLATELRAADRALGTGARSVALLSVNADPLALAPGTARAAAAASGLGGAHGLRNWQYLTGSLAALDRVWTDYGISIDVQRATGQVAHNEYVWLVSPSGSLAYRVTPFADQSRVNGSFGLSPATEARFGAGIAEYARRLLAATAAP